jgi:hypothetical protein
MKDEIGRNGRDQRPSDSSLPGLGFHNFEQQADEEKGIDEESNLLKRKRVSCYGCQDDDDIPPSKRLLTNRFHYFFLSCHRLKKAGQGKDKHGEARTKREKTWPRRIDCAEFKPIRFNTDEKREEKPKKITVKRNATHLVSRDELLCWFSF